MNVYCSCLVVGRASLEDEPKEAKVEEDNEVEKSLMRRMVLRLCRSVTICMTLYLGNVSDTRFDAICYRVRVNISGVRLGHLELNLGIRRSCFASSERYI